MENFPIANSFLRKSYIENDKVRTLLPQLEEALKRNQQVRKQLEDIQPELRALEFQSTICDQVINVSLGAQRTAAAASESVETCHKQIVNLERLINELEIGNILNYTVKCKEDQTLRELTLIKNTFDEESKQLDLLDARPVVKNIRELLIQQESCQNDLAVLEQEADKVERQMLKAMKSATEYRNKKIIQILENRKLILAIEAKSQGLDGSQSSPDSEDKKRPSMPSKGWSNASILLPALDFLSKFMLFKTKDNKEPEQKKDEMALQSILHRSNGSPSPTKQVRFVASPDLESVHIVNRLSSISTDDGSVGRPNTEPNFGSELKQMEKEECEEELEYGEEEAEEANYMSAEEDELVLMETDGEEAPSYEESGAVAAGKQESTQVKTLPHKEGAIIERNGTKWSLEKNSNNKNKAEVLDITIMPPTTTRHILTEEFVHSEYERLSQEMKQDKYQTDEIFELPMRQDESQTGDDDFYEVPRATWKADDHTFELPMATQKADDDIFELPMAQPREFEQPAQKAGSPPSSDLADSMLNFSETNCEFNDDFWLSNNDNDNDNTTADPFYNL